VRRSDGVNCDEREPRQFSQRARRSEMHKVIVKNCAGPRGEGEGTEGGAARGRTGGIAAIRGNAICALCDAHNHRLH
jgi:hypothetical protein